MRILVLGGSGMLGHKVFQVLGERPEFAVFATVRSAQALPPALRRDVGKSIRTDVDVENFDTLVRTIASIQPDVVINCVGIIKQLPEASDPLTSITMNAQMPHRIALICHAAKARFIHVSTDCVFKGDRGAYTEADEADAQDLYGRTKHLGEVVYPHCVTLRTSIIGHELRGHHGLVDWFLHAGPVVDGFRHAYFSGVSTYELARIMADHVIPRPELTGLYHVSADRISKYDLLCLVRDLYQAQIEIRPSGKLQIDRSLRSDRFREVSGYHPPAWHQLVAEMHKDYVAHEQLYRA